MAQLIKTYSINLFSQDRTTWPIYTTQIDTKSIFVVTRIFFFTWDAHTRSYMCVNHFRSILCLWNALNDLNRKYLHYRFSEENHTENSKTITFILHRRSRGFRKVRAWTVPSTSCLFVDQQTYYACLFFPFIMSNPSHNVYIYINQITFNKKILDI